MNKRLGKSLGVIAALNMDKENTTTVSAGEPEWKVYELSNFKNENKYEFKHVITISSMNTAFEQDDKEEFRKNIKELSKK